MDTALQKAVCPELQRIGDVDRDGLVDGLDVLPRPVGGLDLQRSHRLAEQQRDGAKVGVAAGHDILVPLVLLGGARAVDHVPQVAVAAPVVAVSVDQVLLRQLQQRRDDAEDLVDDLLVHEAVEALDLGVVAQYHIRVRALVPRNELENVVQLDVVAQAGEELDGAPFAVAVVIPSLQVGAMPEQFLRR